MSEKFNPHKDHRERVRKEFLENGFSEYTPPHKILELLLFYSIPRRDTNEIAHALLNRFGSLPAVLEASPYELMQVKGIGENSAALIKLLLPIYRLYENGKPGKKPAPTSMDDVCDYITNKYIGFTKETFAVTSFNSRGEIIAFDILNSGDVTSVGISTRSVIEKVLERNSVCAVISHNHPSGNALPSPEDVEITKQIFSALAHINVRLLDHIIVSNDDDDCISMAQTEAYYSIFK